MTAKKLHTALYEYKLYLHTLSSLLWTTSYYKQWFAGVQYVRTINHIYVGIPDIPLTYCYFLSLCVFRGDVAKTVIPPHPFVSSYNNASCRFCSLTNIYREAE